MSQAGWELRLGLTHLQRYCVELFPLQHAQGKRFREQALKGIAGRRLTYRRTDNLAA
jgi:hypothetical protein